MPALRPEVIRQYPANLGYSAYFQHESKLIYEYTRSNLSYYILIYEGL